MGTPRGLLRPRRGVRTGRVDGVEVGLVEAGPRAFMVDLEDDKALGVRAATKFTPTKFAHTRFVLCPAGPGFAANAFVAPLLAGLWAALQFPAPASGRER